MHVFRYRWAGSGIPRATPGRYLVVQHMGSAGRGYERPLGNLMSLRTGGCSLFLMRCPLFSHSHLFPVYVGLLAHI